MCGSLNALSRSAGFLHVATSRVATTVGTYVRILRLVTKVAVLSRGLRGTKRRRHGRVRHRRRKQAAHEPRITLLKLYCTT